MAHSTKERIIRYLTLDRTGIILNMLAGIFFGLNYFISDDLIVRINNSLTTEIVSLWTEFNKSGQPSHPIMIFMQVISILFLVSFLITQCPYDFMDRFDIDGPGFANYLFRMIFYTFVITFIIGSLFIFVIAPAVAITALLLNFSPKGFLGLLAIICFIMGNALQLKATSK